MGRPRKFRNGDMVWWVGRELETNYGVVVGYLTGLYRVVRVTGPVAGKLYGQTTWRKSHHLFSAEKTHKRAPGIVRANERLGKERGCSCNCCPHVSIPRSEIRQDGTLKWEEPL